MAEDTVEWWWVDERGEEEAVSERDLIGALSAESIPCHALVWRTGWAEWLHAYEVSELSWALPAGQAKTPVRPRQVPSAARPRPNLERCRALAAKAGRQNEGAQPPRPATPKIAARVASKPKPRPKNDSEPTLRDLEPPQPPASAGGMAETEAERPGTRDTWVGGWQEPETQRDPRPPSASAEPEPYVPPPSTAPPSQPASLSPPKAPSSPGRPGQRSRRGLLAAGLALSALAALGAGLVGSLDGAKSASETTASTRPVSPPSVDRTEQNDNRLQPANPAPSAPRPLAQAAACRVSQAPKKLADWSSPDVTPVFAKIPGSARVALGYAQAPLYAIGVSLDPRELDHELVFRAYRPQPIVSVVPLGASGQLRFAVERKPSDLQHATTVDAAPPFALGQSGATVSRRHAGGTPEPLWKLAANCQISPPQVTRLQNGSFLVALSCVTPLYGEVHLGKLSATGEALGGLQIVKQDRRQVAVPVLAAAKSVAIVFASRDGSHAPWRLQLGFSEEGTRPTTAQPLNTSVSGELTSPRIVNLGDDGFLLTYTALDATHRRVYAQRLDRAREGSTLVRAGDPILLSPAELPADNAALVASGTSLASVHFVKSGEKHELWAVGLSCPAGS